MRRDVERKQRGITTTLEMLQDLADELYRHKADHTPEIRYVAAADATSLSQ